MVLMGREFHERLCGAVMRGGGVKPSERNSWRELYRYRCRGSRWRVTKAIECIERRGGRNGRQRYDARRCYAFAFRRRSTPINIGRRIAAEPFLRLRQVARRELGVPAAASKAIKLAPLASSSGVEPEAALGWTSRNAGPPPSSEMSLFCKM